MDTFLWIISSLTMAGLLALLAARGVREIFLPLREDQRLPVPEREGTGLPWYVLFFGSLGILWLGTFLAYVSVSGDAAGFFAHFLRRFSEAGDSPRYLFLAQTGYVSIGENVNNIVFYPLYPFLVRCLSTILGGRMILAGILLSQVCYGLSVVVLGKLAAKECAYPRWAIVSFMIYPFGFFALGVYTEGLFLLLTSLGLWLIREKKWALAGLASFLCALTRTQGILLLIPGVYAAWRHARRHGWDWRYLCLAGSLAGFFVYLCLNKAVCGDFFAYQYYESIAPWWQTPQWLGATVAQQWNMALDNPALAKWIYWPQLTLYFIGAALLFAGWRRGLDMPWLLYGTAYLGMCYTASWLISGGRYMAGCFPVFLSVGMLQKRWLRILVLVLEAALFGITYIYYAQGQAIM